MQKVFGVGIVRIFQQVQDLFTGVTETGGNSPVLPLSKYDVDTTALKPPKMDQSWFPFYQVVIKGQPTKIDRLNIQSI